jgi:basic membrane lipoprotein Med (substrate-binding protein (PBP1-ABC) superfamily)
VINTQAQYPDTVVASALWNMEPSVDRAIQAVKAGKFKAEDYGPYSMMKHKGSSLAPLGTFEKKVPADLQPRSRPGGRHPGRQVHRQGGRQPAQDHAK